MVEMQPQILTKGVILVQLTAGRRPSNGGGGQRGTTSFINHASATNANITAKGKAKSSQVAVLPAMEKMVPYFVVRPQVSSLNFTSGTLTIDASAGEITHSDGSSFSVNLLIKPTPVPMVSLTPTKNHLLQTRSTLGPVWWSM